MLKKIRTVDLRVGMYIQEFCGSWIQHPFWRNKFLLEDPNDIRLIQASDIADVWIDTSKGLDVLDALSPEPAEVPIPTEEPPRPARPQRQKAVPLSVEIDRAAKICANAKVAVTSMFQEARLGNAIDSKECEALVSEISSSVLRNPGAIISLARLKSADEYTYMHSVAVCALMVALANQLELDEATTRAAGMAGLLHDLGKALMPLEVLNKPGKLTSEEFNIIKRHPEEGHRMLLDAAGVGEIPLDVCLHHHEKMDGTGYPERLAAEQISLFAKMGAVCDIYDAITSNRPYKSAWTPAEAVQKMAGWCNGQLHEPTFRAFVRSVGIYPIGSLVKLRTGKLAVVIEQNERALTMPVVKAFYHTKTREALTPMVINLSSSSAADAIVQVEDPDTWKITRAHVETLWSGL